MIRLSISLLLFGIFHLGAFCQYEKTFIAPAEIRANQINTTLTGKYKTPDDKIIYWEINFDQEAKKVYSIKFKHPDGEGPSNQNMPPSEFWVRLSHCVSDRPNGGNYSGAGNVCIEDLISQALSDCYEQQTPAGVVRHCWML